MTVICYLFLLWASVFKSVKWREKRAYKRHAQSRGPETQSPSTLLSLPVSPFLSLASPLSCRGSREQNAASLPQHHHSCGGHRGDHSGCPHRCGTHRGGGYFVRVMRSQVSALGSSEVTELRPSIWGVQRAALLEAMWAGSWGIA